MNQLTEQRLVAAHKLGIRDYIEARDQLAPSYMSEPEREAYHAGYRGAERRKLAQWQERYAGGDCDGC
jgi:hypothetical protein